MLDQTIQKGLGVEEKFSLALEDWSEMCKECMVALNGNIDFCLEAENFQELVDYGRSGLALHKIFTKYSEFYDYDFVFTLFSDCSAKRKRDLLSFMRDLCAMFELYLSVQNYTAIAELQKDFVLVCEVFYLENQDFVGPFKAIFYWFALYIVRHKCREVLGHART